MWATTNTEHNLHQIKCHERTRRYLIFYRTLLCACPHSYVSIYVTLCQFNSKFSTPRPLAVIRNRRLNSVALLDPLRSVQFST